MVKKIKKETVSQKSVETKEKVCAGNCFTNDDHKWNPAKNHNVISIVQQSDGNYIGAMWKEEQVITARQGDPQTVLTMLITGHGVV